MRSIYNHLIQNIFTTIIFIYVSFLVTFFIVNVTGELKDTKDEIQHITESKEAAINDYILYYEHYNIQVKEILQSELQFHYFSTNFIITPGQEFVLNNLFSSDRLFKNFIIVNSDQELLYSSSVVQYNNDLTIDTKQTEILRFDTYNNHKQLSIVHQYEEDIFFIYLFNDELIDTFMTQYLENYKFHVMVNEKLLLSNDSTSFKDIPTSKSADFIFMSLNYSFYKRAVIYDDEYIFVIQYPIKTILSGIIRDSMLTLLVSFLVLLISLGLLFRNINRVVLKSYHGLLKDLDQCQENNELLAQILQQPKTKYFEIANILKYFSKIIFYHKKIYENKIIELNNDLQLEQESNKAKTLFLANMSHEMRTPLNSIIGYTQLTKKIGFNNIEKVNEYFESINNSSEILLQKINDILDLSKIENKKFELNVRPTHFKNFIKELYQLLNIQAQKKNIDFTYYVDPQIPTYLDFDSTRLKQVLINLCSNAIKFTDKGFVKLSVEFYGYNKNNDVIIDYEILDTGCGIPKDQIDNIFIPFVQVNNNNSMQVGTGLGLTIARDIVRLMGGDIKVTSKEFSGTIFTFSTSFKISEDLNTPTHTIDIDNDVFKSKINGKQILIVEDNLINQIFMKEIFAIFDKLDIDIASDGSEAVEKVKSKHYDLVLMDIQMPKMTGIEATKIIRSIDKFINLPIIALTANAFSEQIQEYLEMGMNDYLPKPVDINRFKRVIMNYL